MQRTIKPSARSAAVNDDRKPPAHIFNPMLLTRLSAKRSPKKTPEPTPAQIGTKVTRPASITEPGTLVHFLFHIRAGIVPDEKQQPMFVVNCNKAKIAHIDHSQSKRPPRKRLARAERWHPNFGGSPKPADQVPFGLICIAIKKFGPEYLARSTRRAPRYDARSRRRPRNQTVASRAT